MLKVNPRLKNTELRALPYESIPMRIELNAKYLDDLRRKVMLYHAQYPDDEVLTDDSASELIDNRRVTDIACEILEDESIMISFNKMHRNMIHNDPDSWTVYLFSKMQKRK